MNDQNQFEHDRKTVDRFIVAAVGVVAIVALACIGSFFVLAVASGESSPGEAKRWFMTVVRADPSRFSEIQHYTDQGIDFSHHFKFRFTELADVISVAREHGLSRDPNARLSCQFGLPEWHDPERLSVDAIRYSIGGGEPLVLIVDPDRKIAYFEMVHL